jgi:RNAse (barnase) inhibitor barstar
MSLKTLVINGNNFSDLQSFYDETVNVLTVDFADKFGRNMNAFDDILLGGFRKFEYQETINLIWKNAEKSKKDLGWPETIKYIEDKLKKCHPSNIKSIENDLKLAKEGKGQTLFEIIVDRIKKQKHIQFIVQ